MSTLGLSLVSALTLAHVAPDPDDAPDDAVPIGDVDDDEPHDAVPIGDVDDDGTDQVAEPTATAVPPPATANDSPEPETKFTDEDGGKTPSSAAIERDAKVDFGAKKKTDGRGRNRPGSKQRFEAEFKLGPYLPDVDRNYDGPGFGPYGTIFGEVDGDGFTTGDPKKGLMPAAAFDWQFIYLAGPLGVGTQVAFFRDRAQALLASPDPGENVRSDADRTTFGMVPLTVHLSYRFELLADRLRWVPIVPYAKAGLGYAFWWIRDGSGKIAVNSAGDKGHGGVLGWQTNLGGMLRLDFIEPNTAKRLDQTTGINHTYLFGELQISRFNNFGIGNSIALGDITWFAGLAIEF